MPNVGNTPMLLLLNCMKRVGAGRRSPSSPRMIALSPPHWPTGWAEGKSRPKPMPNFSLTRSLHALAPMPVVATIEVEEAVAEAGEGHNGRARIERGP